VTPVGDIEIEIVLHIAVRGRARDLAQLLKAIKTAEAAVIRLIEKRTASGEQGQKQVTTTAGGFSG
jgi:hypothetical protein